MILLIFILLKKSQLEFFDFTNKIQILPSSDNIHKDSLFGYDVKYSYNNNIFYVGAPRALKASGSTDECGAVYKCPINLNQPCSDIILPLATNSKFFGRILFGMSLYEVNQNTIRICSPNKPYIDFQFNDFCLNFNTDSHFGIEKTDFPNVRFSGNDRIPENYGMQIEPMELPVSDETAFIYSQINWSFRTILEPMKEEEELIVVGSTRSNKVSVNLRSIPGHKFLINYKDSNNFLIVPYPDPQYLFGSLDVFTKSFSLRQSINIYDGTPGQQFGFSGAVGLFNNDNCFDFVFSSPYYSIKPDQGAIYIFYCDPSISKFMQLPEIFLGENEEFALYGISIANIQDRNSDSIDELAVLAPYWYKKNPVLYIYYSSPNGFETNNYRKLDLQTSQDFSANLAFKLLSDFDIDGDKINELAVTYPINNRFEYYIGVKFINIIGKMTFKTAHDLENSVYLKEIRTNTFLYVCDLIISVEFKISHLTALDIAQKPILKYKISLEGRDNSFFNTNEFPVVKEDSLIISESEKMIKLELPILYWFYIIPEQKDIPVVTEAWIEKNPECNQKCLTADKITFTTNVFPIELVTNENEKLPKITFEIDKIDPNLDVGNINERQIKIIISYEKSAKSLYPEVILNFPDYITIVDSHFTDVNDDDMTKRLIKSSNKTNTHSFITKFEFSEKKKLIFVANLELIPSGADDLCQLFILVKDAIYQKSYSVVKIVSLEMSKIPISISGNSVPNIIDIMKDVESEYEKTEEIVKYNIEIFNNQKYYFMSEVYLIMILPLYFEEKQIFEASTLTYGSELKEVECSKTVFEKCSKNVMVYFLESIGSSSITRLLVKLNQNENTRLLADNNVKTIEISFILKHKVSEKIFTESIKISTTIRHLVYGSKKSLYISIIVAVILSGTAIGILIYFVRKFNLTEKLKAHIENSKQS